MVLSPPLIKATGALWRFFETPACACGLGEVSPWTMSSIAAYRAAGAREPEVAVSTCRFGRAPAAAVRRHGAPTITSPEATSTDDPDRDAAVYTESDHMPSWAQDDPDESWDAADLYERANGRLYVSADFALPRDLDPEDQIALAHEFAKSLTEKEQLPYTLAIHAGHDEDGHEHNPHAHIMFSERQNDGVERSREQWFRRADREHPECGGAPKSRTFHGREWVETARERWASMTNAMLERQGREERVDHRSYERQGIDREPGQHYGPSAAHVVGRGHDHERLDEALAGRDHETGLRAIDEEIARLEATLEVLRRDGSPDEERESPRSASSSSSDQAQRDDDSRGR